MIRHLEEELTAYLDRALSPERTREVEDHLRGCAGCRAERDRLVNALRVLAALPPPPAPSPDFSRGFYARLDAEPSARPGLLEVFSRPRWRNLVPIAGGAVTLALVVGTVASYRAEQARLARGLDLYQDYELVAGLDAVQAPEDVEVVGHLDELPAGGRP
ncbi:MAG TPA: zf-HC2 domain-containing protein [Anaeromyxobacteraceae bacterium]|jgi:anti-sigma factor RsiW|nr:zf-HC2 domain-containing protein [Anaeromyxobacteraceae bacterium]